VSGDRKEPFLQLSELLTGFGTLALCGTGMADAYLETMDAALSAGNVDELLAAFGRLLSGAGRDAAVVSEILDHPKLGPMARSLILLWYTGAWTPLPDGWRATYGASPLDTKRVVSPASYQAGLQWVAAKAHPAGGGQQGFGSWAASPESAR